MKQAVTNQIETFKNKFDKFVFSSELYMPNYNDMKDNLDQAYESSSYESRAGGIQNLEKDFK